MRTSESIANIAKALLKVQKKLEPVKKDATNPHFKSTYASYTAMQEYVTPILNEEGLVIVQGGEADNSLRKGVTVTTMLVHAESGEFIEAGINMPLADTYDREGRVLNPNAQQAGSAISYGRRYLLSAILALATEEDDDGEAAAGRPRQMPSVAAQTGHRQPPAAVAQRPTAEVVACPKCGSDMWDNRATKTNPRQPDFKCKDRTCDGAIWPSKSPAKPATQHVGPGLVDRQPDATENIDDDLPF